MIKTKNYKNSIENIHETTDLDEFNEDNNKHIANKQSFA